MDISVETKVFVEIDGKKVELRKEEAVQLYFELKEQLGMSDGIPWTPPQFILWHSTVPVFSPNKLEIVCGGVQ